MRIFRLLAIRSLAAFALLLPCGPLLAQTAAVAPVSRTLAITGATIVPRPGATMENATVVIRDGVITAIGTGVALPFDAREIKGDSLWIYAGFIDALSNVGVEMPSAPDDLPPVASRADPPDDRAGIEPYRRVATFLDASSDDIESLRSAGFTAAHVVPGGGMLPGSGAVILLRGKASRDMLLRTDASLHFHFRGGSGMYPSTPMGKMAKFRQLYREAGRRSALADRYERDPRGMPPPQIDATHEAFYPVVRGEQPVAALVNDALEARRVLSLQSELGFELLLAGLGEGFDMTGDLAQADARLAITLAMPDSARWLRGLDTDSLRRIIEEYDPDARTATFRDVEAEIRNLEARQAQSTSMYASNAATMAGAGVRFGFTSMGVDADDIRKNLLGMIGAGLPQETALAALTIDGARAIGADDVMGTLERGKLGNLVITSGPLFEPSTEITHVVVAGELFEVGDEDSSNATELKAVLGRWRFTADAPDGAIGGEMLFRSGGGRLRGTVTYDGVTEILPIRRASITGGELRFFVQTPDGDVEVTATVSGKTFTGTAVVAGSPIPITGSKIP